MKNINEYLLQKDIQLNEDWINNCFFNTHESEFKKLAEEIVNNINKNNSEYSKEYIRLILRILGNLSEIYHWSKLASASKAKGSWENLFSIFNPKYNGTKAIIYYFDEDVVDEKGNLKQEYSNPDW